MHSFPHKYEVNAQITADTNVKLSSTNKPTLESAPPAEFDGPGDAWSPEEFLVASVADCFVLSFRAIASASRLSWDTLNCHATGTLDIVDKKNQFTEFHISATLQITDPENKTKAERLLNKAEEICLITNSLKAPSHLTFEVVTA